MIISELNMEPDYKDDAKMITQCCGDFFFCNNKK